MAQYHIQTRIDMASGVTADAVVQTYHVSGPASPTEAEYEEVCDAIWDTVYANPNATALWSNLCSTGATHLQKVFAQADAQPRVPRYMKTQSGLNVASSGIAFPPEVACVISFKAADIAGQEPRRRRNRIYLGPVQGTMSGSDGRISSGGLDQLESIVTGLSNLSILATGWDLNIFSPYSGVGLTPDVGWADNEWDTQRRRGRKATTRRTVTF